MKYKILIIIIFISGILHSQITTNASNTTKLDINSKVNADAFQLIGEMKEPGFMTTSYPVEGVVDANKYIIGQGDVFTVGLYGYLNQILNIPISLEGSLIIPTVGEIKVSGLTLNDAKEKVIKAVKKRYYSSDVSFTLTMPRTFLIQVSGLSQGTFPVTFFTRPSQIIHMILFDTLNVSKKVELEKPEKTSTQFSLRNIELHRKDGSKLKVDIYKYFMTKDDKYNPTFREGDLLKIPYTNLSRNCISVNGAVQLPGTYEYSVEDNLETVIGLGRGLDANAEPDSIVVFRPVGESTHFETYNLSLNNDKDFKINVFDRIFAKYKSNYQKMISVKVEGEVLRAGYYPITFKNTRIKDVIEMAGGLKQSAYLPLSILFRKYDEEYLVKDTIEFLTNLRTNDLIITDKDKLNFEGDIRARRNRVNIDFTKLYNENDLSQNVIVEDKDIIYINDDKKIVYVYGQVGNEGYIPYKKGETAEYYIQKAGGFSLAAEEGDVRVIKFNSRGWYKPKDVEIMSGDFVYVPKKVGKTFTEWVSAIAQISGVILGVISTYLLFKK